MTEKLLKVSEVADILKVSQMTIIRRCRDGSLPFVMVGTLRRIREIDLEYFIISQASRVIKSKTPDKQTPVYDGPPASECGFETEEDEIVRKNKLYLQCEALKSIVAERKAREDAMKEAELQELKERQERGMKSYTGQFPSGFVSCPKKADEM